MKIQEIREIIKLIDQSTLDEFVYETEGTKIKMKKKEKGASHTIVQPVESSSVIEQPKVVASPPAPVEKEVPAEATPAPAEVTQVDDSSLHKISSPMVGTFYQSSSPDTPPYVKVGDKITPETIVCIVEAMKLFNEIEAEVAGEIVEILVKDGQLVEYGQPLFLVKK